MDDGDADRDGMFDVDYDAGGAMDWSFEDRAEALMMDERRRIENMLLETEFKLFEEQHEYDALLQRKKMEDARSADRDQFRYYSEGYHAHVDEVDDLELARWQSKFQFMHIVGMGLELIDSSTIDPEDERRRRSIPIAFYPGTEPDEEEPIGEEIFAIHGDDLTSPRIDSKDDHAEEEMRKRQRSVF